MVSRVSSGFREDCLNFLSDFAKLGSPNFHTFCQEWKRTSFQNIFCGRNTAVELVEYTGEIFCIVKQCFFCCQIPLERIGAFYLLYALYFKQPMFLFCKIRITLSDWRAMKEFMKMPYNGQELPQMKVILWKLFKADAFRFVQEELECGFDTFFVKSLNNRFDYKVQESFRPNRHLEKELQTMQGPQGIIKALEILEMGYNEMKEALDDCEASSPAALVSDKIPQSTLMESLRKDVDSLLTMMGASSSAPAPPACSEPAGRSSSTAAGDPAPQHSIGNKRYSLRRNAYKRVIKQRKLHIAGQETAQSDDSDASPDSSSSPEKPTAGRSQPDEKDEFRGFRAIRRKKTYISDDEDDDDDAQSFDKAEHLKNEN